MQTYVCARARARAHTHTHTHTHIYTHTHARARAQRLTRVILLGQTSRRYLHFPWNIPNRARCSRDFTRRASTRIARTYALIAKIMLHTRPFQSAIKEAKCKGSSITSWLCHYSHACVHDIARLRGYRCTFIIHEKDDHCIFEMREITMKDLRFFFMRNLSILITIIKDCSANISVA